MNDEAAIRNLVERWMTASMAGDAQTVLGLMTDDVVYMVPGREPFGKEAFEQVAAGGDQPVMEGRSEIVELNVLGDWAYLRAKIEMSMTLPGGQPVRRAGYTLTLLRKGVDSKWRIARDANLLTVQS